jgi:hypothetical protein
MLGFGQDHAHHQEGVMNMALNMALWMLRTLIATAAVFAYLTGNASAQGNPLMPHFSLGKDQHKLTPEEQDQQDQIDSAYQAATKKIPDQKPANDPWADVRQSPTTASQNKKQQ